jgi:fructose-bisphosphate aldolase class I
MQDVADIARALVAPGKGILAADESTSTIKKRFDAIGVENTEANRRAYREMLFRTPGISQFISGVILYDETIRQKAADGTPFVKILRDQGILPGIKADIGAKPLAFSPNEVVTDGLDGLRERLAEYRELGAVFSKWRAVIARMLRSASVSAGRCSSTNALNTSSHWSGAESCSMSSSKNSASGWRLAAAARATFDRSAPAIRSIEWPSLISGRLCPAPHPTSRALE